MPAYPVLRCMRLITCLGAVVYCAGIPSFPALAQTTSYSPTLSKSEALLRSLWTNESQSGVLIVVPPNKGYKQPETEQPRHLTQWLEENGLILRSFGNVRVLGDRTIAVPVTKLGPPDPFDTGNPWVNKRNSIPGLLASLSSAQWKQIASPQGLARNNLSEEQKALWEIAIPNPFTLVRTTTHYKGREIAPENRRTLTDAERQQVRLRVKLEGMAFAKFANRTGRFPVVFQKSLDERGETFLDLQETGAYESAQESRANSVFAYGQNLARYEPNRPKALPARFTEKLTKTPVMLADTTREAVTVGKLLDDISAAIGVKLFAADALRKSDVVVVNKGSVAADDLLQPLLFATNHAVRILPPNQTGETELYAVVPNSEPAGRVAGNMLDWYVTARRSSGTQGTSERIREQNPVPLLRFDADDPAALPDVKLAELMENIAQKQKEFGTVDGVFLKVALTELPAANQKIINDRAKALADTSQQKSGSDYRVRVETLEITCGTALSYIVPGTGNLAGEIDNDSVGSLESWLPRVDFAGDETAAFFKGRILLLSADSESEVRALIEAARKAEAKEVWLRASPELVAAAVGVAGDMSIRPVVSLLRVAEDTPATLPRDENLYGKKSREWLVPDDPEVIRRAAEQVQAVAAIPGIAGIVLRDVVPPGYRGIDTKSQDLLLPAGEVGTSFFGASGNALGYSLEHRRAYLQETGIDPADLIESLPVKFEWESDPAGMRAWQDWRHQKVRPLWSALQKVVGGKDVLVGGEAVFNEYGIEPYSRLALFIPWSKKEEEPLIRDMFPNTAASDPRLSPKPGTVVCVMGNPDVRATSVLLIRYLKRGDKPEETVCDLSDRRTPGTPERLRLLSRLAPKVP